MDNVSYLISLITIGLGLGLTILRRSMKVSEDELEEIKHMNRVQIYAFTPLIIIILSGFFLEIGNLIIAAILLGIGIIMSIVFNVLAYRYIKSREVSEKIKKYKLYETYLFSFFVFSMLLLLVYVLVTSV